jgi:hypothetical protein
MSETSNVLVLGLGFVLGLKHATDPDHIVAVTTFLGEERQLAGLAESACSGGWDTRSLSRSPACWSSG